MSIVKKVSIALVVAGLVSSTALADASHHHGSTATATATATAAANEGKVVFKARVGVLNVTDKSKDRTTNGEVKFKNGFIGEVAAGYFFTDNIAAEGSIGFGRTKLKDVDSSIKNKAINIIPITALIQYHFIPEAVVSPYVGLGYSYQILNGGPSGVKIKNGGGVVGQAGVDIPFNDTMGFNIDAKYTYKAPHDYTVDGDKYKVKLSTVAITAGVTFPF